MTNNLKRKEITKITITHDDGTEVTIDTKSSNIVALFWGDIVPEGVIKESSAAGILGTFYDNFKKGIYMTRIDFENSFGKTRTDIIFPKKCNEILITKELIRQLWETPNSKGELLSYIGKFEFCHPGMG